MRQNETLKKKIINDLEKTGFPLEVFAANILTKSGWRSNSSVIYVDPDTKSTRELDINGLKIYDNNSKLPNDDPSLFSHLIVQCKKSDKPWVFFNNARRNVFWLGYYSLKSTPSDFMSTLCFHGETIGFSDHRYKGIKPHKSFYTALNSDSKNKDLYEALITVCKALEYFKKQYSGIKTAHFFTPIIILDGTLWSATLGRNSAIKIKQVKKLIVEFDFIFGDDKKPNMHQHHLVEIVTREELENTLKEIDKDNTLLFQSWIKYLQMSEDSKSAS